MPSETDIRQSRPLADIQWSDFDRDFAMRYYPSAALELFRKNTAQLRARSSRGEKSLTILEELQLSIVRSIDQGASLKFRNGKGPLARKLDAYFQETLKEGKKMSRLGEKLFIPGTSAVIDETFCNLLMIGVFSRLPENSSVDYLRIYTDIISEVQTALDTVKEISQDPVFTKVGFSETNWRSLFEQLVRAKLFNQYQPKIITSVGGTSEAPSVAAAVNVLPSFHLARLLKKKGYKPKVRVSFASEFAIQCNRPESPEKVRENRDITQRLYEKVADIFFQDLVKSDIIEYETLPYAALRAKLPEEYIRFVKEIVRNPEQISSEFKVLVDSLMGTSEKRTGVQTSEEDAFDKTVDYLLSHQLIFRDMQVSEYEPFIIKVGNPGERRFSRFQEITTQAFMNDQRIPRHVIPNGTYHKSKDGIVVWSYGQISLSYPKTGERPPYFSEKGDDRESIFDVESPSYHNWKSSKTSTVERYTDLEWMLGKLSIDPDKYLEAIDVVAKEYQ